MVCFLGAPNPLAAKAVVEDFVETESCGAMEKALAEIRAVARTRRDFTVIFMVLWYECVLGMSVS